MKYFVFSDVHGCYDAMINALKENGYDGCDEEHKLLFLGDAFDKDSEKREDFKLYCFLKENVEKGKLLWIKGNHDTLLLNTFKKGECYKFTKDTVSNLAYGFDPKSESLSEKEKIELLIENGVESFIKDNCLDYFETDDYVFTHGAIPYDKKKLIIKDGWRDYPTESWEAYRSCNGMKLVLFGEKIPGKTLVCGHVGTYFGYLVKHYPDISNKSDEFRRLGGILVRNIKNNPAPFDTFYGDGVIGLDGHAYERGKVNVLVVED